MVKVTALISLLCLVSCARTEWPFKSATQERDRKIASVAIERLMTEEEQTFESQLEERLLSLHSYYVISQKHLALFDKAIEEENLQNLYQGTHYLSLMATRTQIDEIEKELIHVFGQLKESRREVFINKIRQFGKKNQISSLSVSNLQFLLGIESDITDKDLSLADIDKEYRELEKMKEFRVYEKNIEHISHLLEMDITSKEKKFKPSVGKDGSVSGQEFPAKVWSLTFSNGPGRKVTKKILENLKSHDLKATFFQLGEKVKSTPKDAKAVTLAGMEVGTQSMSHKELSKAGLITLEREITLAKETMEQSLRIDVKLIRLPYGSGIEVPVVREVIAKNKLIHVFWNIDSLDWPPQTADRIVRRTKKLMKKTPRDAGVILFHDVQPRTIKASNSIMEYLKLDARRVCTLGTIINEMNQGYKTVCSNNSY